MATWEELDSTTQEDLTEWLNIVNPDEEDLQRLADLHEAGQFYAVDCGGCGDRIRRGHPDNWDHFQGVRDDEGGGELCSDCYGEYRKLAAFVEDV